MNGVGHQRCCVNLQGAVFYRRVVVASHKTHNLSVSYASPVARLFWACLVVAVDWHLPCNRAVIDHFADRTVNAS